MEHSSPQSIASNGRSQHLLITADVEESESEKKDLLVMLDEMDTNEIFDEIVDYRREYKEFPTRASGIIPFVSPVSYIWDPTIVHDDSSWKKLFEERKS